MTKKILFVVNDLNIGGLQRVVSIIADALNALDDFESSIFIVRRNIPQFYSVESKLFYPRQAPNFLEKIDRKFCSLRNRFDENVSNQANQFLTVEKFLISSLLAKISKNNFDAVILTADYTAYAPFIKKAFPNLRVISWMHNNFDVYMDNYFKNIKQEFINGLQVSDLVVSLTAYDAEHFAKYSSHSVEIANPVTIENPKGTISNLQKHVISWVGRTSDWQHKGTDYLLKITAQLPDDWIISVAGDKDPLKMINVLDTSDIQRAQQKLVYVGSLKGEALADHYVASSIFLMTSRWEGFGLVMAEAMSFGLPLVAFDQTGARSVTRDGEYGQLVKLGDVAEMNHQLSRLIGSQKLREQWQKKSLLRVQNYLLKEVIQKWVNILK
ncbi:glycosyltransferase [Oenococcus sicerae]|uniref:glycosyltransferase n=1 Tax=Oenococcus sicerae TaxID=2203724 RepID=UPI0039E839C9